MPGDLNKEQLDQLWYMQHVASTPLPLGGVSGVIGEIDQNQLLVSGISLQDLQAATYQMVSSGPAPLGVSMGCSVGGTGVMDADGVISEITANYVGIGPNTGGFTGIGSTTWSCPQCGQTCTSSTIHICPNPVEGQQLGGITTLPYNPRIHHQGERNTCYRGGSD